MGKLGDALRKKYKTPRAALRALGLDEKLLDSAQIAFDGAQTMKKPTRLEHAVLMRTAAAINPILAMDAKVNYAPILKGLTTKNFAERKPKIVSDLQKALKGKTIAKDASIEHLAKMLDTFESGPGAEKTWDESVSEPQHKAMEAAAHGESNLAIPKKVGQEFERADKGKTFGDMIRDWATAKDWSGGMSDDDIEALNKMHTDATPPEFKKDKEEGEDADPDAEEGEDGVIEEGAEEADDEDLDDEEKRKKAAADRKAAKDKAAKDRKDAMDKKPITQDELNKALVSARDTERKAARETAEAREFVRPYVGQISLAMDTAEQVLRSAAKSMQIEDAENVHPSALKQLIKMAGQSRQQMATDASPFVTEMAYDEAGEKSFATFFPGASRIGTI